MSFKVVRNVAGNVVAFGPNNEGYEPSGGYDIEESMPALHVDQTELILSQIASLEQAQLMPRATREFMLIYVETNGLTTMPGYAPLKAFDEQIKALRSQL